MNSLPHFFFRRLVITALLLATPCLSLAEKSATLSLDFPGGPLSKFVEKIHEDNATQLNIINPEKADPVLPSFSVRDEYPERILGVARALLASEGYDLMIMSPTLAVLRSMGDPLAKDGFAAFQLGKKLGWGNTKSVELTIAAIQTACEFAGGETSTLRFKFHHGTKMLFVAGPQRTIDRIVRQVIDSLPEAPL